MSISNKAALMSLLFSCTHSWGAVFLLVGSISHVFQVTYGFSQGQASTVLICGFLGASIGWFENYYLQERFC